MTNTSDSTGRKEIEKAAQPIDVIEIRYGPYELRIPPDEDFETIQAQFNAALAYLKKKLASKEESKRDVEQ